MEIEFEREREELSASDWKHMYCILLRGIDAALERMPVDSRGAFAAGCVLRKSMEEAEEYYISSAKSEN